MNPSEFIPEITDAAFESQVRQNPLPVLVLFHAPDCHACRPLEADLAALAPRYGQRVVLVKIDAARHQELASRLGVTAVPMLLLFRKGVPTYQFIGVPPRQELIAVIEALPPVVPEPDMAVVQKQIAEREAQFLRLGYDSPAAVAFVLAQAQPLGGNVLEIGTGKGRFLAALAKTVDRVTTVDIDPQEQQIARLNARAAGVEGKIQFVLQDAAHLPWPDQTFDAVVTMNAIHHIKDFPTVLEEMLRVVKPGGQIVLADFSPRGFQIMERLHRSEGRTHERHLCIFRDVQKLLRGRGWMTRISKGSLQEVLVARRVKNKA